ncbi:dihydropteroate synthase [Halococcus hamelinensis]|uniref:Probable bifunctional folylpolyglutamate synthase/dihydropteroate synthase n=1 Tax=Halococcus hamelinensis 100A6 TaxID=1132509 RepID=M0LUW5_9EURY|nr:dihydropteroate synthase [Halococcus hamelinensis]EMA37251.1 dihydropteroate synthase [Halococcus hamelinensis 100A6]
MEYHEARNALERLRRVRPKLGTATTATLLDSLDDPHEGMTAVQVAGSNGKGSTARVLERILDEAGLDVGLYTSPDLNDLRERIRVRRKKIPKSEVGRFVETVWPHVTEMSVADDAPTFFETFTALALWYFERKAVDVAILEVGIGGRYDATSVVDPVAAAVTSVSLEHTDILGDTVEEIARDQVQVAPPDVRLVTGATGSALEAIEEKADTVTVGGEGADVVASEMGMVSKTESQVSLVGPDWDVRTATPLLGDHQAVNAGIAATLARQVGNHVGTGVDESTIESGIRNVHWPGRFEVMRHDPLVVLDGAHNPDAAEKLATLLDRFEYDDLYLVFGAMRDKDHRRVCRSLPPVDRAFLAEPAVGRSQGLDTLAGVFRRETDATVLKRDSIRAALDAAIQAADPDDCVVTTGSLYAVAEARDRWTRMTTPLSTSSTRSARSALSRSDVPTRERDEHVDQLVHRSLRMHVRREEAATLEKLMLSIGGSCGVSGVLDHEPISVVLSGNRSQFRRLVQRLRDRSEGDIAAELNGVLELDTEIEADTERTAGGYPWDEETTVMGILNVTPDSFHDGGDYRATQSAVDRAEGMVAAGAGIVDVGGESTRPGAEPVSAARERDRVLPVIERLDDLDTWISIDTRKPTVAEAALEAGADLVNDVTGLEDAAMRRVVADFDVPAVMMHSLSAPVDPDHRYEYDDVVDDVLEELTERILLAERAGIDRSNLIVDPGLGFGKTRPESFALLDRLDEFRGLGTSLMIGHSQKSMFEPAGTDSDDRLIPTVAATALAVDRGVDIVRVHEVAENAAAIATAEDTVRTD